MAQREIKGIIFDMDGLLLDTEPLYEKAIQAAMSSYNSSLIYDKVLRSQVLGRGAYEGAELICKTKGINLSPKEFLDLRDTFLADLFPHCTPMPGAEILSQHLHKHKLPIAVASSSLKHSLDLKLKNHSEWFKIFDFIITGDDPRVKNGKPAPDIFLLAANGIGVDPKNCIVFEDSPSGCQAGASAGCFVVAVPSLPEYPEKYTSAHLVISSLTDLKPEKVGLPPYD
eukprot:TRINITY_DN8473_c0_g1_i1.p1 TRINITY_DN8473_c0_g1~~TRINITY_DN8473_c0_g1_i1.p1  ORF type:complete len:253 (-),score=42.80 TRINITY_DN8473_c0_g1_i1:151-831(-)